jgi:hypothetical protein
MSRCREQAEGDGVCLPKVVKATYDVDRAAS